MYEFKRLSEISKRVLVPAGIQMQYSTNSSSWMSPWADMKNARPETYTL